MVGDSRSRTQKPGTITTSHAHHDPPSNHFPEHGGHREGLSHSLKRPGSALTGVPPCQWSGARRGLPQHLGSPLVDAALSGCGR